MNILKPSNILSGYIVCEIYFNKVYHSIYLSSIYLYHHHLSSATKYEVNQGWWLCLGKGEVSGSARTINVTKKKISASTAIILYFLLLSKGLTLTTY